MIVFMKKSSDVRIPELIKLERIPCSLRIGNDSILSIKLLEPFEDLIIDVKEWDIEDFSSKIEFFVGGDCYLDSCGLITFELEGDHYRVKTLDVFHYLQGWKKILSE